jgi:hypothetical protein
MQDLVRRLADELAVHRLMSEYCICVDDGRFADVAALFCEDGIFETGGVPHSGRQAIIEFLEVAQSPERRGRHTCSSALVAFDDDYLRADTLTDFVFFARSENGWKPSVIGRYHDRLRRDAERWRYVERRVEMLDGAQL